jgi:adenosylmethionine-8-amino-7-oxononanoate aminotransferase
MNSLVARDARVLWHPFTQAQTAPAPLPVRSAQGAWLTLDDGRRLLDGISSWWTCTLGHGHPALVEAIARQAATLDHVLLAGATHEPAVAVAERLVALTGLARVFYSDDGSTAVEVALRMAVQAQAAAGAPERTRFLALELGYHGDTLGAASVGDPADYGAPLSPRLEVDRVPAPPPLSGLATTATLDTDAALQHLARLLERHGHHYAAVILEPMVQGAGGMAMHSPDYVRALVAACREAGLLVIADEVMTGFGRTGALWATQLAGIQPDILCLAKGLSGGILPLAATVASEEVYARFLGPDLRSALLHGHSFTGNPIACAAALANLRIWQGEGDVNVLGSIAALQHAHGEALTALQHEPTVTRVRWLGGIGALDLAGEGHGYHAGARAKRVAAEAVTRGVLVRPLGPTLYLMPPYCTTTDELKWAWQMVAEAIDASRG